VIHAVYRLAGVLNIDKQYTTGEGGEEQISAVGRVKPAGNDGAYTVRFSELGRPPAYDGKTALTVAVSLPVRKMSGCQSSLQP